MKFPFVKFPLIVLMSASIAFISSCKHELDYPDDGNGNPIDTTHSPVDTTDNDTIIPPPPVDTMICFESQILPLFVSNCAMPGCHDAATHEEGLRLYTYSGIVSHITAFHPTSGSLMHSILGTNDIMPPSPYSPMSSSQIALIQQWINQGAQNTTNCANTCDTTAFTYSADIAPIMSTFCNGCHGGAFPSAGINTSSWSGLQASVTDGSLLGSVEHNSNFSAMPKNAAKMDDCNITKIRKWIQAGAPNN